MEKFETVDFEKELRRKRRMEAIARKCSEAAEWIQRNKEAILIATPVAAGAVKVLSKAVSNAKRCNYLKREKNLRELYCYDRSLGHYWKLRKPLSNSDWTRINNRRNKGEALADILISMNVLD